MSLRTSPCTSGVYHACITVHRACPSPPLYPPVRDTHARGLYGPCAYHAKLAQAERGAARRLPRHGAAVAGRSQRGAGNKRISGLLLAVSWAFVKRISLMRVCSRRDLVWDDKQLRLQSIGGRVLSAY